jgi:hypothetical protein
VLLEFGTKVLGFPEEDIKETPAFTFHQQESAEDEKLLFQSRVLAFAQSTWKTHVSACKDFLVFCAARKVHSLTTGPSIVHLFLLHAGQIGKSYGYVERFASAYAFFSRFFLTSYGLDPVTVQIQKFLQKACPVVSNKKDAFGSAEVRAVWDSIDKKSGGIPGLTKIELRTFVMAVFQHKTFCRFSDLAVVKLDDVFYTDDYFKVKISCSKTDQKGEGHEVFLVKSASSYRDPHMLMCLYLSAMGFEDAPEGEVVYLFPPLK